MRLVFWHKALDLVLFKNTAFLYVRRGCVRDSDSAECVYFQSCTPTLMRMIVSGFGLVDSGIDLLDQPMSNSQAVM